MNVEVRREGKEVEEGGIEQEQTVEEHCAWGVGKGGGISKFRAGSRVLFNVDLFYTIFGRIQLLTDGLGCCYCAYSSPRFRYRFYFT